MTNINSAEDLANLDGEPIGVDYMSYILNVGVPLLSVYVALRVFAATQSTWKAMLAFVVVALVVGFTTTLLTGINAPVTELDEEEVTVETF